MNKSQLTGAAIMVVAAVQMLAFGLGALKRSYAAVAKRYGITEKKAARCTCVICIRCRTGLKRFSISSNAS